jgi:hypothetical protein
MIDGVGLLWTDWWSENERKSSLTQIYPTEISNLVIGLDPKKYLEMANGDFSAVYEVRYQMCIIVGQHDTITGAERGARDSLAYTRLSFDRNI